MKCQEAKAKLIDLKFNDLDSSSANELQDHLLHCTSCQKEMEALERVLSLSKEADSFQEPSTEFWSSFDDRFEKRLSMESRRAINEDEELKSKSTSVYKMIALAASLLIIIVASSLFTDFSPDAEIAVNESSTSMTPIEVLGVRTEKYFDDAKKLLFNILYTETGEDSLIDITLEKEYAAKLLKESRYLQTSLPESRKPELVYLVNQLESTLLQIAHLEAEENAPEVEIIQDGIRKNAILMKINLHKINQLLEENRKKENETKEQKSEI